VACPPIPVVDWFCSAGNAVASSVAGDVLTVIANAVIDAEKWVIGQSLTLWTDINTPGANSTGAMFLQNNTAWIVAFVAVLGLLIAAIRLGLERRAEPAKLAARGLVNLAVATGGGVAIISLGAKAGDAYSSWIINLGLNQSGTGTSVVKTGEGLLIVLAPGLPVFLVIIFGIVGIIASIAQIFLLVIRVAMLGLLAGVLPIAAAASNTESGKAWFAKICGWVLAFLLYKPVAATIYAYAFVSLSSNSFVDQASGMAMLVLSVIALPALMRLVTPMVAAATHQGGSGAGAAFTALAVALGARALRSSGGADGADGAAQAADRVPGGFGGPDSASGFGGHGSPGGPDGPGEPSSSSGPNGKVIPGDYEWTDGRASQRDGGKVIGDVGSGGSAGAAANGAGAAGAGAGAAGAGAAGAGAGAAGAGAGAAGAGAGAAGAGAGGAAAGAAAGSVAGPVGMAAGAAAAQVAGKIAGAAKNAAAGQAEGPSGSG
jgi:type IV secretion system protein TrbL